MELAVKCSVDDTGRTALSEAPFAFLVKEALQPEECCACFASKGILVVFCSDGSSCLLCYEDCMVEQLDDRSEKSVYNITNDNVRYPWDCLAMCVTYTNTISMTLTSGSSDSRLWMLRKIFAQHTKAFRLAKQFELTGSQHNSRPFNHDGYPRRRAAVQVTKSYIVTHGLCQVAIR